MKLSSYGPLQMMNLCEVLQQKVLWPSSVVDEEPGLFFNVLPPDLAANPSCSKG